MNNNGESEIIYNLKYKDDFLTQILTDFYLIKTDIRMCLKIYDRIVITKIQKMVWSQLR